MLLELQVERPSSESGSTSTGKSIGRSIRSKQPRSSFANSSLRSSAVLPLLIMSSLLDPGPLIVRADGYLIQIKSGSIDYVDPISSLSISGQMSRIAYHGTQNSDGIIIADAVTFQPNDISNREGNLLKKTDYDPAKGSG